jgi:hypothetical protein
MNEARAMPARDLVRADAIWAAITAFGALTIYVRTLAPGLIPILDTPGFQFVGRVLGTLHHPGYPAYTMVTWLWSYLPIGSLAYRINLFSAVAAAVAVAGAFVLMRLLGVRRWIAAAAALGMAFGSIYWSQAVIAEVYALNAALIAWMLAAMAGWTRTRRAWQLYAACGVFAAGLGNHTTIVLFAPAVAVYALMVNRRYVLRVRTLAPLLLLILLGLSQYLFILIRTRMGAVYLESQAATLSELIRVMQGAQFEHALFAFPLGEVLSERITLIVGRFVSGEMTLAVLACAAMGVLVLLARQRREAVLLLTGLCGQLLFVLNYDASDIHVFTIPSLLLLWTLAGAGVEGIAGALDRTSGPGRMRLGPVALAAAVVSFPVWQGARNFADRDLSDDTLAIRQLDALFASLPDDSFLIRENFVLDRMLIYKILGENAGAGREIQAHNATAPAAAAMHRSGRHLFAFAETAHRYRYQGVNVRFSPFAVYEWTLAEFISQLPAGSVVALAVPGAQAPAFHRLAGDALGSFTLRRSVAGREQAALAAVGVIGAPAAAKVHLDTRSAVLASKDTVHAKADALIAGVEVGGRDRVATRDGAVLAVVAPDGRLQSVRSLSPESGFRIRAGASSFIPSQVLDEMPERPIGAGWGELSEGTGLWLFTLPAGGRVEIFAFPGRGCDLRAVEKSSTALQISAAEALDIPAPLTGVERPGAIVLTATEPAAVFVSTGCRAPLFVRAPTGRASVREASLSGMLDLPDRASETMLMARTNQSWLLGAGWSGVDSSEAGPFRWISGAAASLLLPLERTSSMYLRVQAFMQTDAELGLGLELDGKALPTLPLRVGWHWYEWSLDGPIDAALHQLAFRVIGANLPTDPGPVAISQIEATAGR